MNSSVQHMFPEQRAAAQDAFDAVWDHFVSRGCGPSFEAGTCLYRSGDEGTNRCAIGVLLSDEDYAAMNESQRRTNVSALLSEGYKFPKSPLIQRTFPDCAPSAHGSSASQRAAKQFLRELQDAHDLPILSKLNEPDGWRAGYRDEARAEFPAKVRAALVALAHSWDLQVPA